LVRIWQRRFGNGRGATLTLADQLVSSASNFALGVLIARAGGANALGAFGIAFVLWLAVVGVNRALVTEPMTVGGSTEEADAQLVEGLLASLILGVVVAVVLALVAGVLLLLGVRAVAVVALVPWIPSLLAQDYCRLMAFRLQRPGQALISDVVFAAAQGVATVGLYVLDERSVPAFLAAWGIGASVGAVVGLVMLGTRMNRCRGGVVHLRQLWPRSRWFLAEFGTAFPASQGYLLLLPLLLGTAEFGLYRAGASLIGPVVVFFLAGGNVGLPECVRRLRRDGMVGLHAYAQRLTASVVALTVAYCGAVAVLASPVLRLTYGDEFTGAAVITRLVAIDYVIAAIGFGFGMAMKAAGQMRRLWAIRAASAAISVAAVTVLAKSFGLTGAGWATVVTSLAYTAGVTAGYRRMRRRPPADAAARGTIDRQRIRQPTARAD
jgi:O-antigen/teichoic acid export membrane protein